MHLPFLSQRASTSDCKKWSSEFKNPCKALVVSKHIGQETLEEDAVTNELAAPLSIGLKLSILSISGSKTTTYVVVEGKEECVSSSLSYYYKILVQVVASGRVVMVAHLNCNDHACVCCTTIVYVVLSHLVLHSLVVAAIDDFP